MMRKFVTALILLAVTLSMQAGAADEKEKAKAPDKPISVIMATTDDGRRVLLMQDGTWHFVEGAPDTPKPKLDGGNKDKLWTDLVSYFAGWKIDHAMKESFILQTDWNKMPLGPTMTLINLYYLAKVSVVVNEDCSLNITKFYRQCTDDGCTDVTIEQIEKEVKSPLGVALGTGPKQVLELDAKISSELNALSEKYKQK